MQKKSSVASQPNSIINQNLNYENFIFLYVPTNITENKLRNKYLNKKISQKSYLDYIYIDHRRKS